jgi:superfamily II DNA helicase RecQ
MSSHGYPSAPNDIDGETPDAFRQGYRKMARIVNSALQGHFNAVTTLTLTANAASTTLTDARLTVNTAIVFDPVTANAAAELYGATMYVTSANRNNGAFVITHANNAQTDRTFNVLMVG